MSEVVLRLGVLVCGIATGACGFPMPPDVASDAPAAPPDGPSRCDPTSGFGMPMPVPGLATAGRVAGGPRLSLDELTIYFEGSETGMSDSNIYVAHRNAVGDPFIMPMVNDALSSSAGDYDPSVSSDGMTLWLSSSRVANQGLHLFLATRTSNLAEFRQPELAAVNAEDTSINDAQPFLTADSKELWFASLRPGGIGGADIWRAIVTSQGLSAPRNVSELNSDAHEGLPVLSSDRLTVYFYSERAGPGTSGRSHIWTSHRGLVEDGFPPPTFADDLNSDSDEYPGWLSADNCRFYLASNRITGESNIYVAVRQP